MTTRLPREDMAVLREAVERQRPALLPLLDTMYHAPLTLEQRDALSRAIALSRNDTQSFGFVPDNRVRLDRLVNYLWNYAPLPREDMAVLREAVERQRPALLPLLDTMYHAPLTLEQRSALRAAVSDEFVDTGLVRGTQPNNRGVFLETLIDYLAHV